MTFEWGIALRLVTIGADLLLIVLLLAGDVRRPLRIALIGMLLGSACYLLNSAPQFGIPRSVRLVLDIFSIFTPFWTWLFARLLFERDPHKALLAGISGLLIASWFAAFFVPKFDPVGFVMIHLIGLLLLADLVFTAWSGRTDDLIERRRIIRLWLPLLVAAQAGGILVFELIYGTDQVYPTPQSINSLSILALTVFAGIALLRTDPELLVETVLASHEAKPRGDLSPSEIVLRDKLEAALNAGYYRTDGLTIASLADHLQTPEHRLRALINRRLGYRNFAAFLNRHRITEARKILANRDHVDLPILTIAMDLGYNSLPTFNRAFRDLTGQTPSDFRREAIERN